MVRRAAPANSPVLIEGESGTGKELVARMLHHWSSRAQGPFVKVSLKSLLPIESSLGQSEIAPRQHAGIAALLSEYVERAAGGTLFLDEISDATPEFQSALLRLIGDGENRKNYGAGQRRTPRTSGVRIVASTNRPLTHEIAAARVRPDLYFALNVIAIQVAPLRERREDIMPLARHFLALHAAESGRALVLTPDAEQALLAYSWPGNVRELENVIERAVVMSSSERISTDALMLRSETVASPTPIASVAVPRSMPMPSETPTITPDKAMTAMETDSAAETDTMVREEVETGAPVPMEGTLQEFLDRAAALRIKKAIDLTKGNRNAAATALGIDRTTLYRLMRRLGL
jgi:DNA-binding NtrC family response regulator